MINCSNVDMMRREVGVIIYLVCSKFYIDLVA